MDAAILKSSFARRQRSARGGPGPAVLTSRCPSPESAPVDLVKAYLSYVIGAEGQSLAAESAGSAPISEALFTEAQAAIDAIK